MKIGKSKDPMARIKQLQTGCPYKITLAGAIRCKDDFHALRVEKALHGYFSGRREQGEWFKCTDAVLCKMWEILNQLEDVNGDVKPLSAPELAALYACEPLKCFSP